MPLQQSAKRPKNPPRFHSSDAVPQTQGRGRPGPSPLVSQEADSSAAASFTTAPSFGSSMMSSAPSSSSSTATVGRSGSHHRKPVPAFALDEVSPKSQPKVPQLPQAQAGRKARPESADDFSTLNFGRRISNAVDPSQREFVGGSFPAARQLVGGPAPTIPELPRAAAGAAHARNESLSLRDVPSSPSPLLPPGTLFSPTFASAQPDVVPARTRAPMEAFASVEMMEGARAYADRTQGSAVFNNGRYEGRASLSSAAGESTGLPGYQIRRADPTENVRAARGGGPPSRQGSSMVPVLPPIEVDVTSIATQLRSHDDARRESEDRRRPLDRTDSGSSAGSSESPTVGSGPAGYMMNPKFSFPARGVSQQSTQPAAPTYSPSSSPAFADIGFANEKSGSSSFVVPTESPKLGWSSEELGGSEKAFAAGAARPSIVALPVYPAPSGALAKSWKYALKRACAKLSWFTAVLSQFAVGLYMYKRYQSMLAVEAKLPGSFVAGWVFLAFETTCAEVMFCTVFYAMLTYRLASDEPKMRLRGDQNLPAVDVFVVSSGQSDQVTFDCAVAAASIDYPPHRFRVMVLDPSSSVSLQREVLKHSKSQACPHLSYHRRTSSAEHWHTKADAVNFGMREASSFGMKGPAEYVAVFEADMLPERNYLRAVLPAILGADNVGLVKAPHGYMNLPAKLNHATATLMAAAETAADLRSGFLVRRAALQEVGGFPADSWLPDGQCEALLAGRGYQTTTLDEVLQWSLARQTYGAQLNTMMINRLGPLRTAFRLGLFCTKQSRQMTLGQRVAGLGRAVVPVFALSTLFLTVAYPFLFSYGGILVLTPDAQDLNLLLQSALLAITLSRVHDLVFSWSTGQPSPRRAFQAAIFAAPYHAIAILRLILPSWMGGYSSGVEQAVQEAEGATPGFWKRVGWWLIDPHTGACFSFLSAVGVALWRAIKDYDGLGGTVDRHQTALTLVLTVLWPSLLWLDFLSAALVPLQQLLLRPNNGLVAKREELVIRDHYSHVARPKQQIRTQAPFRTAKAAEALQGLSEVGWAAACVAIGLTTQLFA